MTKKKGEETYEEWLKRVASGNGSTWDLSVEKTRDLASKVLSLQAKVAELEKLQNGLVTYGNKSRDRRWQLEDQVMILANTLGAMLVKLGVVVNDVSFNGPQLVDMARGYIDSMDQMPRGAGNDHGMTLDELVGVAECVEQAAPFDINGQPPHPLTSPHYEDLMKCRAVLDEIGKIVIKADANRHASLVDNVRMIAGQRDDRGAETVALGAQIDRLTTELEKARSGCAHSPDVDKNTALIEAQKVINDANNALMGWNQDPHHQATAHHDTLDKEYMRVCRMVQKAHDILSGYVMRRFEGGSPPLVAMQNGDTPKLPIDLPCGRCGDTRIDPENDGPCGECRSYPPHQRRLLDMITGWGQYIEKCLENRRDILARDGTYDAESEKLRDLYQLAGSSSNMDQSKVTGLVMFQVLQLLLNGIEQKKA